jgi:hypothetical protein
MSCQRNGSATHCSAPACSSYPHGLQQAMAQLLESELGPAPSPDNKTVWTPLLLAMSAILVALDSARSLGERLGRVCSTLGQWFSDLSIGSTYQGWVKALGRLDELPAHIAEHLRARGRVLAGERFWARNGQVAFVVDGTRVDCPRTGANKKALHRAGKKGTGPQLYLTVLYHVGTGLPFAWQIGRATADERKHLRRMLKLLPKGALVIADAGFVGYALWREVRRYELHILIRGGGNLHLIKGLKCAGREGAQSVYLWPENQRGKAPMALRLIQRKRAGKAKACKAKGAGKIQKKAKGKSRKSLWLVTDLSAQELSDAAAGRLYTLRWEVEVFFRSFKQTLARRKMCSCTPEHARRELEWMLLGLWVAQWMTVRAIVEKGHDPLSWSCALALRVLRQSADAVSQNNSDLTQRLGECRKDKYQRHSSKTSHRGPNKKTDKPPGDPKIRPATPEEIIKARKVKRDAA